MTHILAVRVTPRSAKPGIGEWRRDASGRDELEIRVAEAPAEGAANEAVIKLIARALGISRSEVSIVKGHTGRHKQVAVPYPLDEVRVRLGG